MGWRTCPAFKSAYYSCRENLRLAPSTQKGTLQTLAIEMIYLHIHNLLLYKDNGQVWAWIVFNGEIHWASACMYNKMCMCIHIEIYIQSYIYIFIAINTDLFIHYNMNKCIKVQIQFKLILPTGIS